jgi:5-(carboxyamino)imidazole ribonucleotide synthase
VFVAILLETLKHIYEMEFHPEANQVEYVICPARIDIKSSREHAEQCVADIRKNSIM